MRIRVAIEWIVQLHSGRASAGDRQAFAAWRARNLGQRAAALAAERLWAQIGEAGRPLLAAPVSGSGGPRRRRVLQAGPRDGGRRRPAWPCCRAIRSHLRHDDRRARHGGGRRRRHGRARRAHGPACRRRDRAVPAWSMLGGRALIATAAEQPLDVRAAGHEATCSPRPSSRSTCAGRSAPGRAAGALDLRPQRLSAHELAAPAGLLLMRAGGVRPLRRWISRVPVHGAAASWSTTTSRCATVVRGPRALSRRPGPGARRPAGRPRAHRRVRARATPTRRSTRSAPPWA